MNLFQLLWKQLLRDLRFFYEKILRCGLGIETHKFVLISVFFVVTLKQLKLLLFDLKMAFIKIKSLRVSGVECSEEKPTLNARGYRENISQY